MGPVALDIHDAHEEWGHACAICQTTIGVGEQVGRCPSCDAPFHGECWDENGGCASYGCSQVPNVPKAEGPAEGSSFWGQEDKACPRCGQRIRLAALRCRHCGQTFDDRAPAGTAGAPARRSSGAMGVWLLALGLFPLTAPLVLVLGGLGLWLARGRVRRWPATRRAMGVVGVAVAAVVSLVIGLVVVFHEPPAPAVPPLAPPDAANVEGDSAADEEEDWEDEESEEESEDEPVSKPAE